METSVPGHSSSPLPDDDRTSTSASASDNSRSYEVQLPAALNLFRSPLSLLLEYSRVMSTSQESEQDRLMVNADSEARGQTQLPNSALSTGEVSIQIIRQENGEATGAGEDNEGNAIGEGETVPLAASEGSTSREGSYQSYDIHQFARWVEQVLPFSLLLLVVFVRQHLQAVIFKSNDILRKQTALKVVIGIYWWFRSDDILYPLLMIPPSTIPPFWHAVFIILVNDTMVRQAAMAMKCLLLIYYKNGRGHNFRRQGQILTLVEYALLLYRALLPTPVWYRFFLNKDYGSLFSSLTTGLYLTFKLTTVVDKVQSLFAAIRALSRKEVHYGSYATTEQVNAAGDLCAICQEKMHAPILLQCKHLFCEDCVSEWLERERTCPLCRALVKPADLRSFGDGSTSLLFQLF
ncbi:RING-type domain-containing protein [Citrus sinensis]|uniref:RING-type domain-containing protein n=1 Tax=Citrus sinensis TaxID=2711 RepID=A0ACB8L2X8_CITSI|nr:RING-type domain-containing protein [Citrus sinensis]